jgi:hypothetical protein
MLDPRISKMTIAIIRYRNKNGGFLYSERKIKGLFDVD